MWEDLKESECVQAVKSSAEEVRRRPSSPSACSQSCGSHRDCDVSVESTVSIFRHQLPGCHSDGKLFQETAQNRSWADVERGWSQVSCGAEVLNLV